MIDNLNDMLNKAYQKGLYLTFFLDEASCGELNEIKDEELLIESFGGFSSSERKRIIIHRKDINIDNSSFKITLLKATYNNKFYQINHRQVLGTLMSLGIEREVIGDIILKDNIIYIYLIKEMSDFIKENLKVIAKTSLEFNESNDILDKSCNEINKIINVASLRLDAVISKVLNISREESSEIIKNGFVLLNHLECTNSSKILKESDLLSIRKFGRITIYETINVSKKNRINLHVGILH